MPITHVKFLWPCSLFCQTTGLEVEAWFFWSRLNCNSALSMVHHSSDIGSPMFSFLRLSQYPDYFDKPEYPNLSHLDRFFVWPYHSLILNRFICLFILVCIQVWPHHVKHCCYRRCLLSEPHQSFWTATAPDHCTTIPSLDSLRPMDALWRAATSVAAITAATQAKPKLKPAQILNR